MPDFTPEMKKEYTIIAPDIFPTHMELIQEVFRMSGYHLTVVHYEGKKVIDTGLKYLHNDMCYPAICSVGQLLYALTCGDFDPEKCALIFFQTGGGCRASNYIWLLRKALVNMGMDYVPVISLSLRGLEKYSGFRITLPFIVRGMCALIYGDMMMLLKNQTAPYEIRRGDTEKTVREWTERISDQFRHGKGLTPPAIRRNMRDMAKSFHGIPREKKELIKVGIVGEIYVKYSSFGNNGLERFLASQGCECMVPGVLGFFQFGFADAAVDYRYYGGSRKAKITGAFLEKLSCRIEDYMLEALREYPEFETPCSFERIKKLADRVIDRGVKMGEGWLLPGETAELIEKGYNNVICAQPFGCLPNHIVGKGMIRRLRELYPDANIFPVDYDAGASRVNQENRIKLMLAIASERAQNGPEGDKI